MTRVFRRWRSGDRLSARAIVTPIAVVTCLLATGGILLGYGYRLEALAAIMFGLAYIPGWFGFRKEVKERGGDFISPSKYTYFSPRGANELVAIAETTPPGTPMQARSHDGPPVSLRLVFTGSTRNPVPDHRCRSLIRAGIPDARESRTAYGAAGCFLLLDDDLSARERRNLCAYLLEYVNEARVAGDEGLFSEGTRWAAIQIVNRIVSASPDDFPEEVKKRSQEEHFLTMFDGQPYRGVRSPRLHPYPPRAV